jgi:asparagine synthase (glutamine-hydrolysing)
MPKPTSWWDVSFAERSKSSVADQQAELLHLLRQGVTSRMVSDVPLGAFLSGGVDSSSVVALMSEASAEPVQTCSIGFDERSVDESDYAQRVAEKFGADHRSRIVSAHDFEAIDALADMFDEPFADASALPTWRVCALARETVTVALSGDGADEALAGYRRHVFQHGEDRLRRFLPAGLRKPLFGALGAIYPKADWAPRPLRAKTTLLSLAASSEEGYARAMSFTPPEVRLGLYSPDYLAELGEYRAETPLLDLMRNAPARSGLDKAQYADLKFWLPGDILTKVDRTSMAVSLEAREPLLDHRLIEYAAMLPEASRIRKGQGKWLLKRTMERFLPNDVLYRPKQGFVVPIAQWFRGPLAGEARAIAKSTALARTGWFDARRLSAIAESHISGVSDHSRLLWQLFMLDRSLSRIGAA